MTDDTPPKLGAHKRAILEATERGGGKAQVEDDMVLYQYPNYETYREIQTAGNKAKLRMQFVRESHVRLLSERLADLVGEVRFGICHGTRRGLEQAWFRSHLPGNPDVIGTEISDTATRFPHTIQWDFHHTNPDWSGRANFVYSNSWDHAFDPVKAFGAWIDSLRPGGVMLLDHTRDSKPDAANALDPFGITFERLNAMLTEEFADRGALLDPIDTRKINREYRALVVVFRRSA